MASRNSGQNVPPASEGDKDTTYMGAIVRVAFLHDVDEAVLRLRRERGVYTRADYIRDAVTEKTEAVLGRSVVAASAA